MSFPRMSVHIGDYKRDTGHLRAAGHGAYFLLTMHYWSTGGLPDDDKQLANIACMTDREWKQIRPVIRSFFRESWRHKRIDKELAEAQEKYEKRSKAGKGGNAKRWGSQTDRNAMADAIPMPSQPITDNLLVERDTRERASETLISREAYRLAEDCLKAIGFSLSDPPLGWSGLPYQTQVMVARGFDHARTVATFARIGPNKPMNYHIKAAESDHIEASIPKPERQNGNAKSGAVIAASDRLIERLADLDKPAPEFEQPRQLCSGTSAAPIRAISKR